MYFIYFIIPILKICLFLAVFTSSKPEISQPIKLPEMENQPISLQIFVRENLWQILTWPASFNTPLKHGNILLNKPLKT